MKPILTLIALAFISCANAQTAPPVPAYTLAQDVLAAPTYMQGGLDVPAGHQLDLARFDLQITGGGQYVHRNLILSQFGTGFAYGNITLGLNYADGGLVGDYVRTHGIGPGVTIARKTAVRGDPAQWGVWGHQYALGPGTKAGIWINGEHHDDEPPPSVPNAIVVAGVDISGAVLQYNAEPGARGVFFRIFQDGRITAELTADGVLRVRRVEVME